MSTQAKQHSRAVAPVSAVCAAFATQPSAYPPEASKAHVAPPCGSKKNSTEAQRGGFGRKGRQREMDETCRLRRAMDMERVATKQEKGLALFCASPSTSARSACSFEG